MAIEMRSFNGYPIKDETARNEIDKLKASGISGGNSITPEQFGAVGDGVHDDGVALQQATDAAAEEGKVLTLSHNKTYRIQTYWNIPSGSLVEGNGAVILTDGITQTGWQASAIRIAGADDANFTRNVIVRNIVIRAADSCPTRYMLQTLRCSDVLLSGITFDCQPNKLDRCCLDMYGLCSNVIIENCVFNQLSACLEGGIWVRGGFAAGQVSRNIRFINCDFYKLGGDEVFAVWSWKGQLYDVLVSGCNFYQIEDDECQYYPAWFITLGQSATDAYVRMENSTVHATRSSTVFRMVGDGTHAVVDNCDITIEQPKNFPYVHGANPLLAQGNGNLTKTIVQNCRLKLKGDANRTLCYDFGLLKNNIIEVEAGTGPAGVKAVIGNTFVGSFYKGIFWDCETVESNNVNASTGTTAWMSGAGNVENNIMNLRITSDAQGSQIFHNNWGSGRIANNVIDLQFDVDCDLRIYDFPSKNTIAQYILNNTVNINGARCGKLTNTLAGIVYRRGNYINGIPERLFECTGVSFGESKITEQYKKPAQLKVNILPEGCTDPVIYTWTNGDGAIIDMGYGAYKPQQDGTAKVKVNCGMFEAEQEISVALVPVPCEQIEISNATAVCGNGLNTYLKAFVTPEWTTDNLSWSSDHEDIATVTDDGKVTGVGIGEATITATCGGKSISCTVSVVDPSELPEYIDGEWVLDDTVAYIPLPNLRKAHSVYCAFELETLNIDKGEELPVLTTQLNGQSGATPIHLAFGRYSDGQMSVRWYTTDVDIDGDGNSVQHVCKSANNSFGNVAGSNFIYLKDGVANPSGTIIWRTSENTVKAAPNTGYLTLNIQLKDGDKPVTDYTDSTKLWAALNAGEIHATKLKGLKIKELIVFASSEYTNRDDFYKYRSSAEIDIRFDANGKVVNAGTSGGIIWSGEQQEVSSGDERNKEP